MDNEYNANMYVNYDVFNNIEDKIAQLTNLIQEKVYDSQSSSLRNIQVGDDLSGKTLYLSFPRDAYNYIPTEDSSPHWFIHTSSSLGIGYYYSNHRQTVELLFPSEDSTTGYIGLTLYGFRDDNDSVNPYVNSVKFKLPDYYGTVTYADTSVDLYQYIKIYDDEDILPDYVKKNWIINEIPYIQDIDNIEIGVKNLGNYFTKPPGWISTKDWLPISSFENRYDYAIGNKGFSYIDINRWITDLNLIESVDIDNSTIWNTNKTMYYWNEGDE